jgi:hypothetical protein
MKIRVTLQTLLKEKNRAWWLPLGYLPFLGHFVGSSPQYIISFRKKTLAWFRTTSDSKPIRTRRNIVCISRRTISMIIYTLDPISVTRFLSVILESPFRKRLPLSATPLWFRVKWGFQKMAPELLGYVSEIRPCSVLQQARLVVGPGYIYSR